MQKLAFLPKGGMLLYLKIEKIFADVLIGIQILFPQLADILQRVFGMHKGNKFPVCKLAPHFKEGEGCFVCVNKVSVRCGVEHDPLGKVSVIDLRDNMVIKVIRREGHNADTPGINAQSQTAFCEELGLIQTVNAVFRLIQTVCQKRQGVTGNVIIIC